MQLYHFMLSYVFTNQQGTKPPKFTTFYCLTLPIMFFLDPSNGANQSAPFTGSGFSGRSSRAGSGATTPIALDLSATMILYCF
jgi:hypothetical protein